MSGFRKFLSQPAWIRSALSYGIPYDNLMKAYETDSNIIKSFTHGEIRAIEATGTQYIATDIKVLSTDNFSVFSEYTPTRMYDGNSIWGVDDESGNGEWIDADGSIISEYSSAELDNGNVFVNESVSVKNILRDGKWHGIIDDNDTETEVETKTSNSLMTVFKNSDDFGSGKLTRLYVKFGNKMKCYLIPFVDENGNNGMYDLINSKFYGNSGTGEFTIDNRRNWIDKALSYGLSYDNVITAYNIDNDIQYSFTDGKTRVLKNDGAAYINTGLIPTDNTYVQSTFRGISYNDRDWYFGAEMWNVSANRKRFGVFIRENSICTRLGDTGGGDDYTANPLTTDANVALGHGLMVVNDQVVESQASSISIEGMTQPLYIFASCSDGSATGNGNISTSMLKNYFVWYENDELIRFYVPFVNSDGESGLYDLVNGVFYGKAEEGTFETDILDS